jgi:multicomponent K+:H+ antiporter subunit D
VVLVVGFFTIIGLARAGAIVFWHVQPCEDDALGASGHSVRLIAPTALLLLLGVVMAAFASPIKRYTDATAQQLTDKAAYVRAVLGEGAASTTRPYRGEVHR